MAACFCFLNSLMSVDGPPGFQLLGKGLAVTDGGEQGLPTERAASPAVGYLRVTRLVRYVTASVPSGL